jgi:hypothetical protein
MTPTLAEPRMSVPDKKPKHSNQVSILLYKGSPAYRDWIGRFSESSRMPLTVLIDRAVAKLAKEEGFEEPPKR